MFVSVKCSLRSLLGDAYIDQVIKASCFLHGFSVAQAEAIASEEVEFFPADFEKSLEELLPRIGENVIDPILETIPGAPTDSFRKASKIEASPVGGKGYYRLGENGQLFFMAKSEHYHTPLGHNFPGYRLIDLARKLGIANATHNNTRGYITRFLEMELVRTANGIAPGDTPALNQVLASREAHVLNRVISLETGSLAVEAGFKMMLARFYKLDETFPEPKYSGKVPVFFVMADDFGGSVANYHGTTVLIQTMRELWPEFRTKLDADGAMKIVPVKINDLGDFKAKLAQYETEQYKVAGFLHEICLMNYGGTLLDRDYIQQAHALCHEHDVPVLTDEIQSCMWYSGLYLFRLYGLTPDFVIIGKGFSGGEYPASKIITTAAMDNLNQFGALVTNGQEELASLSYLVTMKFVEENGEAVQHAGERYETGLHRLPADFPELVEKIEGIGLLAGIHFRDAGKGAEFAKKLNLGGIDASAHGYKAKSLPAVLTKMPLISSDLVIDTILGRMRSVLETL